MIGIAIANSLGLNKLSVINADAQAFLTAASITGTTQVDAVNTLVNGLQQDGLWSKMKAIYPFVTDNRNLLSYTDDFSNAYWNKSNLTVTVNSAIAPNGTLTADTLIPSVGTNVDTPCIYTVLSSTVETRTLSFYAKPSGYNYVFARVGGSSNTPVSVFLLTGSGSVVTNQNNLGSTIESVGNGWYRCTMTYSHGISFYAPNIGSCSSTYTVTSTQVLTTTNGTSGTLIWGAQLELGSTPTTYQPILGSQQAYISSQFKYNLKDPRDLDAAFRLVFNGGWTHSSTGATPNGTNGYADTKLNPLSVFGSNYASHGTYYRETFTMAQVNIDGTCANPFLSRFDMGYDNGALIPFVAIASDTSILGTDTDNKGLVLSTRQSVSSVKMYRNNVLKVNNTLSFTTYPNFNYFIAARNQGGAATVFSNSKSIAFKFIADSLTDSDVSNLTSKVQAFQTALSRQV